MATLEQLAGGRGDTRDILTWSAQEGCVRCGRIARYYVHPYWATDAQLCSWCCQELATHFDMVGWPMT